MYPLIEDVSRNMIEHIAVESKMASSGDGLDARELSAKFTTDVVSSCIFGLDAGSLKNKDAKIRKMGKELMAPSFRFIAFFLIAEVLPVLKHVIKIAFVPKHIEQFFAGIMKDAIAYRLSSGDKKADYLNYLLTLREKKNLSDLQMVAHAVTFFIDGFETSSIAMSYLLYELARNGEAQEKLRTEIREAEAKGDLSFDEIADLPYLDQAFHESLRLNPPAVFISKRCMEEIALPMTRDNPPKELLIERGIVVNVPIYPIHRDPANYSNPDEFIPERFDAAHGGVKAFKDRGMFLAFGDGPRICLGMKFATAQVKAAVVDIVRNYELTVNAKTQQPLIIAPKEFLNVPQGGLWLNFKKIK